MAVSEEAKAKAAYHFKNAVRQLFIDNLTMYGYQDNDFQTGLAEAVLEIAVQYAKRMRGIDVPIDYNAAVAKLRSRRR